MDPVGIDGTVDGDVERRGAGRGRGRGSWAPMPPNTQQVQMRRPRNTTNVAQTAGPTETKNMEQSQVDKSPDDILKSSTLSVHAAEFVPKSVATVRQTHKRSGQDRMHHGRESQNFPQGMHGQYYGHNYENPQAYHHREQMQADSSSHQHQSNQHVHAEFSGGAGDYKDRYQESGGEEDNYIMDFTNTNQQLQSVIQSLILNPGHFNSLVPPLINNLRILESSSQLREIIGIIIQQSINEGNFRYSGARLCTCLDCSMLPNEQALFRDMLYSLCKEETQRQSVNWTQKSEKAEHSEQEQRRCHGLILFLAELVIQMDDIFTFGLGELLVQLITVVLRKPAPNTVKHVCQALKLAGKTLEKDKRGSSKEMENMMRALTDLVTDGRVDSHVGRMVHSVNELRNGNWGQGTSTCEIPSTDSTEISQSNQVPDEPVLYGPDGKVLSPEENQFLEDVADSNINTEDNVVMEQSFGDSVKWTSEDEDELDAAYEEFLKLLPKKVERK